MDKELAEHEEFTKKAKAEIERLTEENCILKSNPPVIVGRSLGKTTRAKLLDYDRMKEQNAELQKQVDELKEERENMQAVIFGLEEDKRLLQKQVDELKKSQANKYALEAVYNNGYEHAVKDTAKEIFNELYKKHTEVYNQYVFKKDSDYDDLEINAIINFSDSLYFEITKYFKKKYGVEVE
jgi:hypothetical protein